MRVYVAGSCQLYTLLIGRIHESRCNMLNLLLTNESLRNRLLAILCFPDWSEQLEWVYCTSVHVKSDIEQCELT